MIVLSWAIWWVQKYFDLGQTWPCGGCSKWVTIKLYGRILLQFFLQTPVTWVWSGFQCSKLSSFYCLSDGRWSYVIPYFWSCGNRFKTAVTTPWENLRCRSVGVKRAVGSSLHRPESWIFVGEGGLKGNDKQKCPHEVKAVKARKQFQSLLL